MNLPSQIAVLRGMAAYCMAAVLQLNCPDVNAAHSTPDVSSSISRHLQTQEEPPPSNLVEISPDGGFYVLGSRDGRIKYIRIADAVTLRTFYHCNPQAIAFSPDGKLLVSAGGANGRPGKIKVWNLVEGLLVCEMRAELASPLLLLLSPDGQWLAVTGSDSRLHLWDLTEGTPVRSGSVPGNILRAAFTRDGQAVVTISTDGSTARFAIHETPGTNITTPE